MQTIYTNQAVAWSSVSVAAGAAGADGVSAFLAAAICHAGMDALLLGIPALNGLALRPVIDATASVPFALLTEAGFGPSIEAEAAPLVAGWAAGAGAEGCGATGVLGARL